MTSTPPRKHAPLELSTVSSTMPVAKTPNPGRRSSSGALMPPVPQQLARRRPRLILDMPETQSRNRKSISPDFFSVSRGSSFDDLSETLSPPAASNSSWNPLLDAPRREQPEVPENFHELVALSFSIFSSMHGEAPDFETKSAFSRPRKISKR